MDIDTFIDELEKVCDCPNQGYIKCLEKVKELKADNEYNRLKEENNKIISRCVLGKTYCPADETLDIAEVDNVCQHFNKCLVIKQGEIDKLKKENEDWKNTDLILLESEYMMGKNSEIKKLKEENEKLKDCNYDEYCIMVDENKLIKEFEDLKGEFGEVYTNFKLMKEENEKLKSQIETGRQVSETYEDLLAGEDGLIDKNKKLQEEIDNLNEECDRRVGADDHDAVVAENEELKEKLDGVKEILQTETLASGIVNRFYDIMNDDSDEEEEICEECKKPLEGDDKCSEGCPKYDEGWKETHPSE